MKPVSKTAFFCCGARMEDAERSSTVCGDTYAKLFMNEEGLKVLEAFKDEINPKASAVARHRIIDDFLRQQLSAAPGLLTVIIGAGFDSRAYRLAGGTWVEIDEPQVFDYKNARLPVADCPNTLHRIPVDFASESVAEKLASFSGHQGPVVVVVEGVLPYLGEHQIRALLGSVRATFPQHTLICDVMTREFLAKYGRTLTKKIGRLGVTVEVQQVEDPGHVIEQSGYRLLERVSIVKKFVDWGEPSIRRSIRIALFPVLKSTFWRTRLTGYMICAYDLR